MSGESVPLDETVALAHLETGTMLLTAPVDVDVPVPRLRRSAPEAAPTARGRRHGRLAVAASGAHVVAGRQLQPATARVCDDDHQPRSRRRCVRSGSTTGHLRRAGASGGRGRVGSRRSRRRRAGMPVAAVRPRLSCWWPACSAGLAVAASFLAPRATSAWPQVVAIVLVAVGDAARPEHDGAAAAPADRSGPRRRRRRRGGRGAGRGSGRRAGREPARARPWSRSPGGRGRARTGTSRGSG